MALNPARATFVTRPFRYETAQDLSVKSKFKGARELVIDTGLSAASAATLASTILNENKGLAQVFKVEIEGVFHLEDLDGGPPRYTVSFPRYKTDGRTFRLVSFETDYMAQLTSIVVRG